MHGLLSLLAKRRLTQLGQIKNHRRSTTFSNSDFHQLFDVLERRILLSTTYYVDSIGGNDAWNGQSQAYVSGVNGPWQTISKVNSIALAAGDTVCFKRGDIWREALLARSGSTSGTITYTDYGDSTLPKPILMGSVQDNATSAWEYLGNNIWSTCEFQPTGSELLTNPSFVSGTTGWYLYFNSGHNAAGSGYRDTSNYYGSDGAGYSITCTNAGTTASDIQFYTTSAQNFAVTAGQLYLLSFHAKCSTTAFTVPTITIQSSSTGTQYASLYGSSVTIAQGGWATYNVLFLANTTASDASLRFMLGSALPTAGNVFSIDALSLKQAPPVSQHSLLPSIDVGNIIFNNGQSCGTRRFVLSDTGTPSDLWHTGLHNQGDFWYDSSNLTVKVYSTSNPATYYSNIELALAQHMIEASNIDYVTFQNLTIQNCGGYGMSGANNDYLTLRNCDFSYIGGMLQGVDNSGNPNRAGEAFEFWDGATYCTVEGCHISQSYDGSGFQSSQDTCTVNTLIFRNNIIVDSGSGFSIWTSPSSSTMSNIYIENNTIVDSGYEWAVNQRPDINNAGITLGYTQGTVTNVNIRNNIIVGSACSLVRIKRTSGWPSSQVHVDYNLYFSNGSSWFAATSSNDSTYTYYPNTAQGFADYKTATGFDAHSMVADPQFVDPANGDYHLRATSPAINAGVSDTSYVPTDYNGNSRPGGPTYDVGAYEFAEALPNTQGLVAYYKLDETSGTMVSDSYGTHTGTRINATAGQTGQVNKSYLFNDSDLNNQQYIAIPRMNYSQITVSAWFYKNANDTLSNADAIVGGWYYNSVAAQRQGFDLRFSPSNPNQLTFIVETISGSTVTETTAAYTFASGSIGAWYYVAATYDVTSGTAKLYIYDKTGNIAVANGDHTTPNASIVPLTAYSNMWIGDSRVNAGDFDGKIDEVKIFNRALSAAEVAAEYRNGFLAACWSMNEGQGSSVYDASPYGNRNPGTITDATWDPTWTSPKLQFNGTNQKVEVTNSSALNPSDSFSISTWVYARGNDWTTRAILSSRDAAMHGFIVYAASNDTWAFWLGNGSAWKTVSGGSVSLNQWTYVTATFQVSSVSNGVYTGTSKIYVNGSLAGTNTAAQYTPQTGNYPLRIGAGANESSPGNYWFNGDIANMRIYSGHVLTSDEILAQYNNDFSLTLTATPVSKYASAGQTNQVNLQWSTPVGMAAGYNVYRSTTAGGENYGATPLNGTTPLHATSYIDTTVSSGTTYYYTVKPVTGTTPSANASNEVHVLTYPSAPSNLTAAAVSTTQINLSWSAPSGAVTGYNVYRAATTGSEYYFARPLNGDTPLTTTTFSDTTVRSGATYYYTVKAVNATGASVSASTQAYATTPMALMLARSTTNQIINTNQLSKASDLPNSTRDASDSLYSLATMDTSNVDGPTSSVNADVAVICNQNYTRRAQWKLRTAQALQLRDNLAGEAADETGNTCIPVATLNHDRVVVHRYDLLKNLLEW